MNNPYQKSEPMCPLAQVSFRKKELNDLITFTAGLLKMPVAVISLNGYEKQFLRDIDETELKPGSLEISFCHHFCDKEEMIVIRDTRFDNYLLSNFMNAGACTHLFFAGMPLYAAGGEYIGALGFFDRKPHNFGRRQKKMLVMLGRQIVNLVEAEMNLQLIRSQQAELKRLKEKNTVAERNLRAFYKSSAFCHMLIGKDLDVIDFNRSTAAFVKDMYGKQIKSGHCVLDYISPDYKKEFRICLTKAFAGRRINKEILIKFESREPGWWNIFLEPVRDDNGKIVCVVYNATDINEQKQQVAEILAKNELLSHIAYVQSHEYRRPVASILGLMEVIRMNSQPLTEELEMMDVAVKELDQQIRRVINFTQSLSASDQS